MLPLPLEHRGCPFLLQAATGHLALGFGHAFNAPSSLGASHRARKVSTRAVRASRVRADAQKASRHVRSHAQDREHPRGEARSVLRVRADILYACLMVPSLTAHCFLSAGWSLFASRSHDKCPLWCGLVSWAAGRVLVGAGSQFRRPWPQPTDNMT